MARTPTKTPAKRKPAATARKPAAKAKAATKKAAPKQALRTAGPSTNDRVNILEMQVQDLQGEVATLRHVLASALRQTPNLLPLYMRYLQGYGEDGGGGK
jgi:TolA-binding protein